MGEQQQENAGGQQENAGGQQQGSGGDGGESKTFTQSQLNAIVAQNRREVESKFAGYDDLKTKAEQFDALTESAKSELERATAQATDFKSKFEASESKAAGLQTQLLRQEIAADKGLPAKLWKRVGGTTKEEIEADVAELLESSGPSKRKPDLGSLKSGAGAPDGMNKKERAAAALRGMNR